LGFTHECHLFSLFPFLVVNAVGIIISQEIEMIAKSAAYNLIHNKFNYLRPIIICFLESLWFEKAAKGIIDF